MVATFVGREQELVAMADLRGRAIAASCQRALVTGEAGIGKTWFCEQASSAASRDGFRVVWGRCQPGESGPDRVARFAALGSLLTESQGPTMIVIDDAQHLDGDTPLLTRFLGDARVPLAVVLAVRTSPVGRVGSLLGDLRRDATTIRLAPFDVDETVALLAAHDRTVRSPETAALLQRITGGSPLHLARAIEKGGTERATLSRAIADAVDRLPPAQRGILALAALLGADGTVDEVASLAGTPRRQVLEALAAAGHAGLADPVRDRYEVHEAVRQDLLDRFDVVDRLDAHAHAAALLAGSGQTQRSARHALAAAVRSRADTERAITACRAAAADVLRDNGFGPADDLLGAAATLAERLPHLSGRAELLVERADAVLASGRLTDARIAFDAAADAAELADDPVLLARAVLGLGGLWVHEHRNAAVRQQVLARQRAALTGLPAGERSLRCRLGVRLAAEAVCAGEPVELLLDALAEARAVGDDRALAEALSLAHNALLGPEQVAVRSRLAEEQLAVASAAGDPVRALFGLLWRTVDRYLLGDPDAERSISELRQRSDAAGVATVGHVVACMDVMRLIRSGRLAEAEAAAEGCLGLGLKIGDADATGFYGVQLLTIRWLQGHAAELADAVVDTLKSASLAAGEQIACRASAVMALASGGRMAEARATLTPLLDRGLSNLPTSSSWLASMVWIVDAARMLDDGALATAAADLLRPFAELPAMATMAVSCLGSVSRALGLAALTAGDAATAVECLERGVTANLRLEHRPAVALTRAELAEALVARAAPGDLARARMLLAEAIDDARAMGLSRRADAWTARAAALDRSRGPVVLRHRGSAGWTVTGGATRIELPDLVGLHYLSRLVEHPGRELAALELHGALEVGGGHELLDGTAVTAYRQRIRDLDAAIDEAGADPGKTVRLRAERAAVAGELARALGLGGRSRTFSSPAERARIAVRKAIKRALDAMCDQDPVLGGDLRRAINTGAVCSYDPGGRPWRVELTR